MMFSGYCFYLLDCTLIAFDLELKIKSIYGFSYLNDFGTRFNEACVDYWFFLSKLEYNSMHWEFFVIYLLTSTKSTTKNKKTIFHPIKLIGALVF